MSDRVNAVENIDTQDDARVSWEKGELLFLRSVAGCSVMLGSHRKPLTHLWSS